MRKWADEFTLQFILQNTCCSDSHPHPSTIGCLETLDPGLANSISKRHDSISVWHAARTSDKMNGEYIH